ncbi:short-chain dehydrogenase/reductase family 16C member 6-like [Macrosteles quadrilineatus]|uniref:short-chain dehydrogenase/reductase family 16C member 6-like n=1 Tax=Macrosteles quadrilineatus TaxID=74068 RepID=UPI0023E31C86|nr:short-chain dehydrogenase/reductase family 16C member 6-like [Macrosteles quadrilineatus]
MAEPRIVTEHSSSKRSILFVLLELVYFIVLLVPNILSAFVRKIFPPKSKRLDGLVVLVTSAGSGLGRELALGFAHHGASVACVDADKRAALETAEEIVRDGERAKAYHTDVRSPEQVAKLSEAVARDLGLLDILVVYHTSFVSQAVEDTLDSTARTLVEDNFLSHVWMVREFLPRMKQRGAGHIVSVTSLAGQAGLAGAAVYSGTCWAVNGFMESVKTEVLLEGHDNIQFTLVNAAVMDTSLSKNYSLNAM